MTNPESQELDRIKSLIRAVPDFPKGGILFQDIFPVFQDAGAIKYLVGLITTRIQGMGPVDAIVGLDSRGFLLGPWIASNLGIAFCPVRKSGKLPPPCYTVTYELEYGSDSFEISKLGLKPGNSVVVLDDLIATGGSAMGAQQLISLCGATVREFIFLIELTALCGKKKLNAPTFSIFEYDD